MFFRGLPSCRGVFIRLSTCYCKYTGDIYLQILTKILKNKS